MERRISTNEIVQLHHNKKGHINCGLFYYDYITLSNPQLQFIEAVGVKYFVFYSHIRALAPKIAASDSFK